MRIIDCYYIKGYGKNSKCIKIHGIGIAYNVGIGFVYSKTMMIASSALSVSPVILCLGVGVLQVAVNTVKDR